MATDKPFLSVIIPSYNEEKNFHRNVLQDVYDFLNSQSFDWELILSDDGSRDKTVQLLEKFAKNKKHIKILKNPHRGKGPTVTKGMLTAQGQYRLFTDFDQSTPITEVIKCLKAVQKFDADVVIGSREGQGASRANEPFHRHLMGRVFNFMVQILALPGIADSQCGFKLFSKEATEKLFPSLVIYGNQKNLKDAYMGAFDVELLYLARKLKFNIQEVPVKWSYYDSDRVSAIKDSIRMFFDIVKIRLAWLTGRYQFS